MKCLVVGTGIWVCPSICPRDYSTFKNWNIYLWGHDFLHSHPRFVLGIDLLM